MNKQLIFVKRPADRAGADTWELVTRPLPELKEGEVLIKTHYVSLDPAMRGWMNDRKSYVEPMALSSVMRAGSVGQVVASKNHPRIQVGDYLVGMGGVQQYVATDGRGFLKVDPALAPLSTFLGALGMTGLTAYFGILEVGKIRPDDVVLISGAAGAVGSVAGQIAKIKGCRVIGIAGGPDKCKYLTEDLGFDGAIDYKNEKIGARLSELAPEGIDVFFDNVGGEQLDIALGRLRLHARVVICGAISQYNTGTPPKGPSNYLSLLVNRASMTGMIVFDWADQYKKGMQELTGWLASGKLKSRESVYEGIENFAQTFDRLFTGEKQGKLVLRVLEG